MLRNIDNNEIPISGGSGEGEPEEIPVKIIDKLSPEEMAKRSERYLKQAEAAIEEALANGSKIEELREALEVAHRREASGE